MAVSKVRPDIRVITRMVPPAGNLVQGQSELAINPALARAASEIIAASQNHYGPAEGIAELRTVVKQKLSALNGIQVDEDAVPFELLITQGATGALVAIAHAYLKGKAALVFEPYYPYHRRIISELGGATESFVLSGGLELDPAEFRARCKELKERREFPLRAIVACSPANPSGKVFTQIELETIAAVCEEFDLLCIADEVYEHYVVGEQPHVSICTLPGMWERTITVNSFSKSWNISGWRLGYAFGKGELVAPLNNASNVFYVCSVTPLQRALARVLMENPGYYRALQDRFMEKRRRATDALERCGFSIYDSGSAFYVWARIPEAFDDANQLNEMLIKTEGVAGVPGGAFTDVDEWDKYMRFCIAREDNILDGALDRLQSALKHLDQ
jgi:aminotransferase